MDTANPDTDAAVAKMIALAARNGVEDLHAQGVFSDAQAPALNRLLRNHIYEWLLANSLQQVRPNDPFARYLEELSAGRQHKRGGSTASLRGAVERAVEEFAAAEGLGEATAWKLSRAASKAAVEAYKTTMRLALGRSKDEEHDRFAVNWWLQSVPDYWEEPEVSLSFQALLDADRQS
jgi:hypothetical protein